MQDLVDALNTVRDRIKKHGSEYSRNEMMTRYALIDPLLRALDWDVSNPEHVVPEDADPGGTTDYAVARKSMVGGAKKFGVKLDGHTNQLVEYINDKRVMYGVLTNRSMWMVHARRTGGTMSPAVAFVCKPDGAIRQKANKLCCTIVYENLSDNLPTYGDMLSSGSLPGGTTSVRVTPEPIGEYS